VTAVLWFSLGMICLYHRLFLGLSGFCWRRKRQGILSLDFLFKRRDISFFFSTGGIKGEMFRCHLFPRPSLYLTVNTLHYNDQSHKYYIRFHLKRLLFLSDFNESWKGRTIFFLNRKFEISRKSSGRSRSLPCGRREGMTRLIFAFRNCFVNAPVIT
jgi:hypothetical protein